MLQRALGLLLALGFAAPAIGQVGIGTTVVHPGAILELDATNRGLLLPRLDPASIANVTPGLLVYDNVNNRLVYQDNTAWVTLGTVSSVATGAGLTGGPITGVGTISIATGGVTTALLADGAVDNNKIALGTITADRLAFSVSGASGWADAGATVNLATAGDNVTMGGAVVGTNKLSVYGSQYLEGDLNLDGTNDRAIGLIGGAGPGNNLSIIGNAGAAGGNAGGSIRMVGGAAPGGGAGGNVAIVGGGSVSGTVGDVLLGGDGGSIVRGRVVVGANAATGNAVLQVNASNQAMLLPRGTSTTAVGANVANAAGLLFFNTTDNQLYVNNGTAWSVVGGGGPSGWTDAGTNVNLTTASDVVGVGIVPNAGYKMTVDNGGVGSLYNYGAIEFFGGAAQGIRMGQSTVGNGPTFSISGSAGQASGNQGGLVSITGGTGLGAASGGDVRIVGGAGSPGGNLILAHDGVAARGAVAIGTSTFAAGTVLNIEQNVLGASAVTRFRNPATSNNSAALLSLESGDFGVELSSRIQSATLGYADLAATGGVNSAGMRLYTTNAGTQLQAVTITPNGNVGIGAPAPTSNLVVSSGGVVTRVGATNTSTTGFTAISVSSFGTGNFEMVNYGTSATGNLAGIAVAGKNFLTASTGQLVIGNTANNQAVSFITNNAGTQAEVLRLTSTGNLEFPNDAGGTRAIRTLVPATTAGGMALFLEAANGNNGSGGAISLTAGSGAGAGNFTGGNLNLTSGSGIGNGGGGNLTLLAGASPSGAGGNVTINGGNGSTLGLVQIANAASSGNVSIASNGTSRVGVGGNPVGTSTLQVFGTSSFSGVAGFNGGIQVQGGASIQGGMQVGTSGTTVDAIISVVRNESVNLIGAQFETHTINSLLVDANDVVHVQLRNGNYVVANAIPGSGSITITIHNPLLVIGTGVGLSFNVTVIRVP